MPLAVVPSSSPAPCQPPDDLTTLLYDYVDKHRAEIRAPEDF